MCAEAKVKDVTVLRLLMIIPRMAMAFASVRGLASSYVVFRLNTYIKPSGMLIQYFALIVALR